MQKPESFEKFYFAKVGMGEACGCAERIIDVYEFNRQAGAAKSSGSALGKPKRRSWNSVARKYGLIGRPRRT